MVTVDMLADNPGTWLFHCHVADHMEAGMMATYTIYQPSTRACPLKFVHGEFWNTAGKFSLAVENVSGKPIKGFGLEAEQFLGPQYLRRPFSGGHWSSEQTLAAGERGSLEMKDYPAALEQTVLGWVFVPSSVAFADGSVWKPEREGECFDVFWRDRDHPKLEVLPPVQMELNLD
jgi:hypothetical protein